MKPTMELRFYFFVTHYEWCTSYEPRGTKNLQQKWVDDEGNEEWRDVPMVTEEMPGAISYG